MAEIQNQQEQVSEEFELLTKIDDVGIKEGLESLQWPDYKIPESLWVWNDKSQEYSIHSTANIEEFTQRLKNSPEWFDGKNVKTIYEYKPSMANTKEETKKIYELQRIRNEFRENPDIFKQWDESEEVLDGDIKKQLNKYVTIPESIWISWSYEYKRTGAWDFEIFKVKISFDTNTSTDIIIKINEQAKIINMQEINENLMDRWYKMAELWGGYPPSLFKKLTDSDKKNIKNIDTENPANNKDLFEKVWDNFMEDIFDDNSVIEFKQKLSEINPGYTPNMPIGKWFSPELKDDNWEIVQKSEKCFSWQSWERWGYITITWEMASW